MAKSLNLFAVATLVLGLAVGAVGGFLVGTLGEPAGETEARATPALDGRGPAESAADAPRTARGRATAGGPETTPSSSSASPAPTAGDGTITGVVLTQDGAPLAGVVVRAGPRRDDEDERDRPQSGAAPDLDAETKRRVASLQRERSATREATTDATGAYELSGLPTGVVFRLTAWRAGWRFERSGRTMDRPPRAGSRCDLRAIAVGMVRVKLLLPDGTPPETASLRWKAKEEEVYANCRGGESELAFEPGSYELTATAGPDSVYRAGPTTVTVAADAVGAAAGAAQELTLQLVSRPGVRGRVTFASRDPPQQFRVAAVRVDGAGGADPARLLGEAKEKWFDGRDEYALTDLEAGTWLVGVTFRGKTLGPSATVAVGTDLATLDFHVEGEPRDWVTLWVRGPDGAPVRDAKVTTGSRGPGGSGDDELEVEADADGSYRVAIYEGGAPMLGSSSSSTSGDWGAGAKREWYLVVASPSLGQERVTYDPAADREVTVRFGAAARLVVTLEGWEESRDRERYTLSLSPSRADRGNHWQSQDAKIDSSGVGTFPAAKPATYEITLSAHLSSGVGTTHFYRAVEHLDATLRAGDNALTLRVPSFHELIVTVEGPVAGEGLLIERPDPSGRTYHYARQKPAEGAKEVVFTHLAAGRFRIVDDTAGDMWITVPGEPRIAFRPRPFDAARVSIHGKGRLADAGLAEGDLVVALDGTEFENGPQGKALLAAAKAKESVKLTVLRGGRRLEIAVDPRALEDGGRLEPWVR